MSELANPTTWHQVFVQAGGEIAASAASFLPRLVGGVAILAVGWIVASLVEWALGGALRRVGLDRASARLHIGEVLERAGLAAAPSTLLAKLAFWLLFLSFLLSTADVLGLQALSSTLDSLVAYIPSVIGAGLTVILGLLLARFVGALVGSAAAAAGIGNASQLGTLIQFGVAGLVGVAALEQLGIATEVLVGPLTALVAAAGISAGLAFALGAHPIVTHILAGHFLKQSLPRDSTVEVSGERGVVERIGATETVLRSGDRTWSIPNATLLGQVVVR